MRQLRVLKTRVEALSLAPYCLLAGMVAAIGSVALVGLAIFVAHAAGLRSGPSDAIGSPDITDALGTILFAPIVETLLLAGCLKASSRLGRVGSCLASALFWGALHGLLAPMRFFGTVWSFLVFGAGYLLWRRCSGKHAFAAAAVPHAIVNSVALAALAASA